MKTRLQHLIAGITMFVLCISVCTTNANAAVIWQDNFDDGNLDGWTIFGYPSMTDPTKTEGNFSASDFMLKVLDDDINCARNDSTVTEGTWSFDMFVPEDDYGFIRVEFMSNGASLEAHGNMSWVAFSAWFLGTQPTFYLLYGLGSSKGLIETINKPLQGWHHIEVSRNSTGHFYVWLNGTLEANVSSSFVTSSTYFQVLCNNVSSGGIDNIVIVSTVKTPPTPTTTTTPTDGTTPPPDGTTILIIAGVGIAVVVIALVVVFVKRR